MRTSADVVIIGAGVTGAALAYTLAKRGIRNVLVLERRFPCAGATGRCGGGIRQQFTSESNIRLAMGSVRIYEGLSEELDYDIEYVQGGYLVLAETEEEVALQREAVALQNELGLPSRALAPEEVWEIVPLFDIRTIAGATFCPTDGHANPFRVVEGYLRAAKRLGVELQKFTEVTDLVVRGGKVTEVVTSRGKVAAGLVVNAAGAWPTMIAAMAGVVLPSRPVRHEILATEPI
ncbi:MAG TPA: FAD-binding oxidoreductase, partial [Candidatus Acetothermia bacterium]|nr:FAD-binding oxidoreductase [Candidatus Acetothermia bacterium]